MTAHTPACSPLPFGGGLGRGADYEERNLEDDTSPCSKHYCFYHYRIGNYQLYEVINVNPNVNCSRVQRFKGSKGSRIQDVQDLQELTLCVELDLCLACYCSAMLKQVYHCSRSSAAFLRHGIADASIALLIWLKRNLQDEKALTLYFRKKGIQTGALCLYRITQPQKLLILRLPSKDLFSFFLFGKEFQKEDVSK